MSAAPGGLARFGLIALLAAVAVAVAALLFFASANFAEAQSGSPSAVDYDRDDDGLIEVSTLAQLNALRWDLDGNGTPAFANANDYALAFPSPEPGMGCRDPDSDVNPPLCIGYELMQSLDFDSDGDGAVDSDDAFGGNWEPIGVGFSAIFDGGGFTLSNLTIARPSEANVGLFRDIKYLGEVRRLGLVAADITGKNNTGGIAAKNAGIIRMSFVKGKVTAEYNVGGIAYRNEGWIQTSYVDVMLNATGTTGAAAAGRLVGGIAAMNSGTIKAAYANGRASAAHTGANVGGLVGWANGGTINAAYSTMTISRGKGLVGYSTNSPTISVSYWDTQASGQRGSAGGVGKTTAQLQTPAGYTGIYRAWNLNLDGLGRGDDPWHFGTDEQYPALKVDFNGVNGASPYEFGVQGRGAPTFASSRVTIEVAENTAPDTDIGNPVTATDSGGSSLTYALGSAGDNTHFAIVASSGQLQTKEPLDFEEGKKSYSVTVTVTDNNGLTASITVTINVTDVNDAPAFPAATVTAINVAEKTASGQNIGNPIAANDPDAGATVTYALGTTGDNTHFAIDDKTGQLKTKGALDYEGKASYTVTVTASDGALSADIEVTITVTDVNEAPVFLSKATVDQNGNEVAPAPISADTRTVLENTDTSAAFGDPVAAVDQDAGASLTYALVASSHADAGPNDHTHFTVVAGSGQLQTSGALDHEDDSSYIVVVTVHDGQDADGNADTTVDDRITITIKVGDVDEPPAPPTAVGVTGEVWSLKVVWTAPTADAMAGLPEVTGYEVQYRVQAATSPQETWWAWQSHNHVGTDTKAIIRSRVGEVYQVEVRSVNHEGESGWAAASTTGTPRCRERPARLHRWRRQSVRRGGGSHRCGDVGGDGPGG